MTASAGVGLVSRIRVAEIFGPTIQGEGAVIGLPTVFVRTGGCDFRCSWCDSLHAVLPQYRDTWKPMTPGAIVETVLGLTNGRPILVTLSGGNPALQPLASLLSEGHARGLTFALETQGSAPRSWFDQLDYLTLSPKPPSSGERCDLKRLHDCVDVGAGVPLTSLKIVVFDVVDLEFVRVIRDEFPSVPLSVQVGNPEVDPHDTATSRDRMHHSAALLSCLATLSQQVLDRGWYDVRVLPQLHTLMWGNDRAR